MNTKTIEDEFSYQVKQVFNEMLEDYKEDQECRKESGDKIQTFADWLWYNTKEFGELMYTQFNEYAGIEESTEDLNYS